MKTITHTSLGDRVEIDYSKKPVIEITNTENKMTTFLTPFDIYRIKSALERAISLDRLSSTPTVYVDNE